MLTTLLCAFLLASQQPQQPPSPPAKTDEAKSAAAKDPLSDDDKTIVTHHEILIHGTKLAYNATVGFLPIRNKQGETEARIFFTAYTRTDVSGNQKRPLMFAFNGGPGSASIWLHLGAIGPKRVQLLDDGNLPPPPYTLVDNDTTWLDRADLVFIDPVGTGFSRPAKPELGPKFWGVQGDIESVGEFIRLYLTRSDRWDSPLFVAGESYGTTRASALSEYLLNNGIALNGVILISSVLNFSLQSTAPGNDLGYALYLPTYTAAAWYHHKLPSSAPHDLSKALAEVEKWVESDYPALLAKGDAITPAEREAAIDRLNRYTGLDKRYLDNANLRVGPSYFEKELLRDQRRTIGRYDSRILGIDLNGISDTPDYDASYSAVRAPFTTAWSQYLRNELEYKTDTPYFVLGEGLTAPWNWGPGGASGLNVATRLRSAMVQNPYMKVLFAGGHYDLATPYFEAKYTINHLNLDPKLRNNVTFVQFDAGHMVYIEKNSRIKLKEDIAAWIDSALEPSAPSSK